MNKILEIKFGSHLYGTSTPDSDTDLKGIYLPTAKEIVLGTYQRTITRKRNKKQCERNTKDDIDLEIFSLDRYLELLMEGQTVALDMLFSPDFCSPDYFGITGEIYTNAHRLLTRNVNAFVGYARQQASRYGIKGSRMDALKRTKEMLEALHVSPNYLDTLDYYSQPIEDLVESSKSRISLEKMPLIEIVMLKGPKGAFDAPHLKVNGRNIPFHSKVKYAKEIVDKMLAGYGQRAKKAHLAGGIDWKALSHAVRVNSEALELLGTGVITFPRPDRDLLLQIKLGELPYEQVAELIEQGVADLYKAHETSTLPDKPDKEWADNFIYSVYSEIVRKA
jgi:hypothetical protein